MGRVYYTEKIVMDRRYTPSQAMHEINVPLSTIYDWIKADRLICIKAKRTMFTGQRLLEAIENRD